jgi:hypothetical protein
VVLASAGAGSPAQPTERQPGHQPRPGSRGPSAAAPRPAAQRQQRRGQQQQQQQQQRRTPPGSPAAQRALQLWHERRGRILSSSALAQLTAALEGLDAELLPPQVGHQQAPWMAMRHQQGWASGCSICCL